MPFYLGLDASTQSLTALLIEAAPDRRAVAVRHAFRYDDELPHYRTTAGALHRRSGEVVSPPLMWVEALDRMFGWLAKTHPRELAHLAALAVSAQQHGSVYLNGQATSRLAALDPTQPLAPQVAPLFSRADAPIWLDTSTTADCAALTTAVGGSETLARRTGSRAFERFTGPQIRKWATEDPAGYAATARIDLVSSFLTSLLIGAPAPLDPGDASGTNLMELATGAWWPLALHATADDLGARLPPIVDAGTTVGTLSRYWRDRYDAPAARVLVGSGDNPSSLIGTGVVTAGARAISLGTSDTVFGLLTDGRPEAEGHIFGAPTGGLMGLTCFANGSLARERIRDRYGLTWGGVSAALRETPPGNGGALFVPWFAPEITPQVPDPTVARLGLSESDASRNVRALIEGQMMTMANHSAWMGGPVTALRATGGASANPDILQVMADVFGATVERLPVTNSAALGAALRACHADLVARDGRADWSAVVAGFTDPIAQVQPSVAATAQYGPLRRAYARLEGRLLSERRGGGR